MGRSTRRARIEGICALGLALAVCGVSLTPPAGAEPSAGGADARAARGSASESGAGEESGMTMWYDEPATDWESQSLPIGNGAMGASIFGGVAEERLQFNEKTLWSGGPGSQQGYNFGNWDEPRPGALQEVQDRIAAEGQADPEWVASKLGQGRSGFGSYQNFGEIRLTQADPVDVTGYRRSLDIADAMAGVQYDAGGVHHEREYFASAADQVVVGRIDADSPGSISFTTSVRVPGNRSAEISGSSPGKVPSPSDQ